MRKSHVQEQGLMTGTSHLADLGKMVQEESESWPDIGLFSCFLLAGDVV
jgi:hypothetical protein